VQRQFGNARVVVRTGSGGFHAYYRHNGEGRTIRPDPRKPIDLIGRGPIVLPPTRGFTGNYEIIHGRLEDLARLEPIRRKSDASVTSDASDLRSARKGERDAKFWPHVARQAHFVKSQDELVAIAREMNELMLEPWPDTEAHSEIVKRCKYWWDKTQKGENWYGIGRYVKVDHAEIDRMLANPADQDAYLLLTLLRRHHWGRDFYFANAAHKLLGWTEKRFAAARKRLLEMGEVIVIRPRTAKQPMLCRLSAKALGGDFDHQ
jgi:hypothetical protein